MSKTELLASALIKRVLRRRGKKKAAKEQVEALENRPEPDAPEKVESPVDLPKRVLPYAARQVMRRLMQLQATDMAASLTYYGVLALFPAAIALVSLLGLFAQGPGTISEMLSVADRIGGADLVDAVREPIVSVSTTESIGFAFFLGLLGALFSASGYVGAFGRAMNRIYGMEEGRPIWKLRPQMLLLTGVLLLMGTVVMLGLALTGRIATVMGDFIGVGDTLLTLWSWAKWPVLFGMVVLMVAMLYNFTPNVRQPRFRWLSLGAGLAILTWLIASALFGFYVRHFSSYDSTYGTLGGVIVFLLWLWLTNLSLLAGAILDAELERARELHAGISAEETVQLPPRDTMNIEKQEAKEDKLRSEAVAIRKQSHESGKEIDAGTLQRDKPEA